MFNSSKFTLVCVSCIAVMLLLWPTLLLACSSRTVTKPRPALIKFGGATTTKSSHIRSSEFTTIRTAATTAASASASVASPITTKTSAAKRTVLPPPEAMPTTTSATLTSSAAATKTTATTIITTTTTARPNITFPTFKCPANYDAWYCLNEATCFTVKIGDSVMYNCECANGFMGPRCEYKELDGSYQPKRPRPILEKASIASGATCILLFLLFVCLVFYMRCDHNTNQQEIVSEIFQKCHYCGSPVYRSISNATLISSSSSDQYNFKQQHLHGVDDREGKIGHSNSWMLKYKDAFTIKRFNKL